MLPSQGVISLSYRESTATTKCTWSGVDRWWIPVAHTISRCVLYLWTNKWL